MSARTRKLFILGSVWVPYSVGASVFAWLMCQACGVNALFLISIFIIIGGLLAHTTTKALPQKAEYAATLTMNFVFWTTDVVVVNVIASYTTTCGPNSFYLLLLWVGGAVAVYNISIFDR